MSFWKIAFTIGFSFLFTYTNFPLKKRVPSDYWDGWGWSDLSDSAVLRLLFFGNVFGSLVGKIFTNDYCVSVAVDYK